MLYLVIGNSRSFDDKGYYCALAFVCRCNVCVCVCVLRSKDEVNRGIGLKE